MSDDNANTLPAKVRTDSAGQSVLAQLLQTDSSSPHYRPQAPGLSLKATELPGTQRDADQSEVRLDGGSMRVLSVMNLAAILYVEFSNFSKSYMVVLSDLGCLFLPKKREKERQIFLNLQRSRVHAKFWREDPNRKSHDRVLFLIPETLPDKLIVQKPGRGRDVFKLIPKEESFFLNSGLIAQVMSLYTRINNGKHLITDVQLVKKISNLSKKQFKDLEIMQSLVGQHRSQIVEGVTEEISKLKENVRVHRNVRVPCAKCNRAFRSNCDLLLHTKTKKCKFAGTLTETIRSFKTRLSSTNDELSSCDVCSKIFINKAYLHLHREIHLAVGHIYPCSKCGKIYLSAWYYLQHKCFLYLLPKRLYRDKLQLIPVENIYGKIERSIVATALTCPCCQKRFNYISQLISHLHLGSSCLYSILNRVRVDHELSIDFQGLVQQIGQFPLSLVVCEVCDETCVGEVAYIMHMDHHKLKTVLECEGCFMSNKYHSLCSFYFHGCQETNNKYCIFCDQLEDVETTKFNVDAKTLAKSLTEILTNFAEYNPSEEDIKDTIEDDDLGLNSTNLTFIDYFEKPETVDVIELN